ncbi:85/88 kDa calcium-independent phospholipase A2-like [Dreissena polymorpha]|uniref:Uncharacterized protein n=1 Tax=Dreissena polymorpha TaxID=45954 RepID=A0A9D4LNK6_DREPO|nr:85/88 kDa calcium-independent phospholipase A2-like [Dreissena polymorpha]XP_052261792.1 85/88 kDa calcium-independent phospholipase A2-like [Dreissena polymorpha]KAH3860847.1 hypothetical protein DPMN_023770 [Dreissena polymorpha]
MSNNPTLGILTEINEYNIGRREMDKKPENKARFGTVVSIGCGYVEYAKQSVPDPRMPSLWAFIHQRMRADSNMFFADLLKQVAISHHVPSYRARAWCHMMGVMFYRFSPKLEQNVDLDCVDERLIKEMLLDTKSYIKTPKYEERIKTLAGNLKGTTAIERPNTRSQDRKRRRLAGFIKCTTVIERPNTGIQDRKRRRLAGYLKCTTAIERPNTRSQDRKTPMRIRIHSQQP